MPAFKMESRAPVGDDVLAVQAVLHNADLPHGHSALPVFGVDPAASIRIATTLLKDCDPKGTLRGLPPVTATGASGLVDGAGGLFGGSESYVFDSVAAATRAFDLLAALEPCPAGGFVNQLPNVGDEAIHVGFPPRPDDPDPNSIYLVRQFRFVLSFTFSLTKGAPQDAAVKAVLRRVP